MAKGTRWDKTAAGDKTATATATARDETAEARLQWLPFEPELAMYNLLDGTQRKKKRGEQLLASY